MRIKCGFIFAFASVSGHYSYWSQQHILNTPYTSAEPCDVIDSNKSDSQYAMTMEKMNSDEFKVFNVVPSGKAKKLTTRALPYAKRLYKSIFQIEQHQLFVYIRIESVR